MIIITDYLNEAIGIHLQQTQQIRQTGICSISVNQLFQH